MRDSWFIRGQVPMTKSEVRAVVLSKLELTEGAVFYDVGAGSGSVSVEAALQMKAGTVYAVEQNPEAVRLIGNNKEKFKAGLIEVVHGMAPEALTCLPSPTHVFIGGSLGQAKEILHCVMKKNRNVRVVMTAITLETISEITEFMKGNHIDAEILQLSVSKARRAGAYHLMQGENPIFIISFGGEGMSDEETLS